MTKTKCPFCSANVKTAQFAETKNFRVIYNIAPILPGHVLIIPKQHISNFLDLEESLMLELMTLCRKVIRTIQKTFQTKSFNWTLQEGIEAGQTIEHLHIHIIPRYKSDLPEPGDWYPKLSAHEPEILDSFQRPKLSMMQLEPIISKLKTAFLEIN